jgi:hypothetical protein
VTPSEKGKTCPYCQFPIRNGADIMVCPGCKLTHHRECWQENGGCTTFACKGVAVPGQDETEIDPSFDELAAEYGSGRLVIDLEDLSASDNTSLPYERRANQGHLSHEVSSGLKFTRRLKALTFAGLLTGVLSGIIMSFYDYFITAFAGGVIGAGIGLVEGIITKQPYKKYYGASFGFMIAFFGAGLSAIAFHYSAYLPLIMIFYGLTGSAAGIGHGLSAGGGRRIKTSLIGGFLGGTAGSLFSLLTFIIIEANYYYVNYLLISPIISVFLIALGIGMAHELSKKTWLRVISGATAGIDYFIDKDKITVGSCSGCDIVLVNDPDVALHHAEITYVNGFEIKTIENAPEILINNKRVRSALLRGGEEVVIGRYRMKFLRKTRTIQASTMPN